LGRNSKDHKAIKTQLESIVKEQDANQLNKTHQTTPFTLIDSAADTSYVSDDTIIQRTMGEMITTTQQDMNISSGDSHNQVSSESLNIIADGQFSMTNAKENITLSAHTGKLEATAKQDVNIASSTKEVEIVATNKITLTAGGASITLDGGDITITAKQFTEKAGKHSRAGGGVDGLGLAGLPSIIPEKKTLMDGVYNLAYQFIFARNMPYANVAYTAKNITTGETTQGITDKNGWTEQFYTDTENEIEVHLGLPWQNSTDDKPYNLTYQFVFANNLPYANVKYIGKNIRTGEVYRGTTDENGWTEEFHSESEDEIELSLNLPWQNNKDSL